jgi:site-specific recombinase XerD
MLKENSPLTSDLVPASAQLDLVHLVERTADYARHSKSPATVRAYEADWHHFQAWCRARNLTSFPAAETTVCLYLSDLAESHKPSSLQRRLAAISQVHQAAGHETPTQSARVRTVMAGIRRVKGTAPNCKEPVLVEDIRRMVASLPNGLVGARDRALLLVGFAGGFRRSELVGLDVGDVTCNCEGLVITLRRSKTDQEGQGRKVGIPYGSAPMTCPARAMRAWLDAAVLQSGPVFRHIDRSGRIHDGRLSDRAVALIVKRYVRAIGKSPERFSGHSLRAGLATSAAIAGASERSIMKQTGHQSVNMVRRYIREGSLFRENAAAIIGL